jgi:hypothetical protein
MTVRGLILLCLLSGCVNPHTTDPKEILRDSVRSFNDALRWQNFSEAISYLPPERRQRFLDHANNLRDEVEISDYEITSSQPKGPERVEIRVQMQWQSKRSGLLRKIELTELWQKGPGDWVVIDLRQRGVERLPLLDVPYGEKEKVAPPADRPAAAPGPPGQTDPPDPIYPTAPQTIPSKSPPG